MRTGTADLLRALAAAALLGALVLGVPLALAGVVGWPLPTTVPAPADIARGLETGVDEAVFLKALACVVWLAWAQVAAAALVELAALARGRLGRPVPLVAGGLQAAVGRLVATAALLGATLAARPSASALAPLPATLSVVELVVAAPAGPPAPEAVPAAATWTVQRRDTLSGIGGPRRHRALARAVGAQPGPGPARRPQPPRPGPPAPGLGAGAARGRSAPTDTGPVVPGGRPGRHPLRRGRRRVRRARSLAPAVRDQRGAPPARRRAARRPRPDPAGLAAGGAARRRRGACANSGTVDASARRSGPSASRAAPASTATATGVADDHRLRPAAGARRAGLARRACADAGRASATRWQR